MLPAHTARVLFGRAVGDLARKFLGPGRNSGWWPKVVGERRATVRSAKATRLRFLKAPFELALLPLMFDDVTERAGMMA